MRVIVCGGRTYADRERIHVELSKIAQFGPNITIVHGAAKGADTLADSVAKELGLGVEPHPARWIENGKAAGPLRNEEMASLGADLLLAFPGGSGTHDMIARAIRHGIWVEVIL